MRTDLFDFDLPDDRIALEPASPRDAARLLVVRPSSPSPRAASARGEGRGEGRRQAAASASLAAPHPSPLPTEEWGEGITLEDRLVRDLPDLLRPGDALVFNDTRVIRAALQGERVRGDSRAQISFNLHKRIDESRWRAFARPAKRLSIGDRIRFGHDGRVCLLGTLDATVAEIGEAGEVELSFSLHGAYLDEAIAALGDPPLPPYIAGKRAVQAGRRRALSDRLCPTRRRRRRPHRRPAFHAGTAGGAGRARHLPPLRHAARGRRHLPARQDRRHVRTQDARRVG